MSADSALKVAEAVIRSVEATVKLASESTVATAEALAEALLAPVGRARTKPYSVENVMS